MLGICMRHNVVLLYASLKISVSSVCCVHLGVPDIDIRYNSNKGLISCCGVVMNMVFCCALKPTFISSHHLCSRKIIVMTPELRLHSAFITTTKKDF